MSSPRVRKSISFVMTGLCGTAVLCALVPLAFILFFTASIADLPLSTAAALTS